jgi:Tol biopolymer transport system component
LITEFNSSRSEDQNILLYSLKEKSAKTLINGGSFAEFFDNHLFFIRNESLFTVSFDPKIGNPGGPEKLLLQSLYTNTNGSSLYAVGGKNLVYVAGQPGSDQLVWVDAEGNAQLILDTGNDFLYPRISPSGDRVAVTSFDGPNSDLWMLELNRNTLSRLTDHPGEDFGPAWHPGGQQLAFSSEIAQSDNQEEGPGIAVLDLNKNDPPKRYLSSPNFGFWEFPLSWSSDGTWLLFASTHGSPVHDLELMNIADERRTIWAQSKYSEGGGVFSPDTRWIAYVSDFSGHNEVYIKSFGSNGPPTQVSTAGGTEPVWSPDGKELYYREYDKLISVPVTNSSPLKLGQPKILFEKSFKMNDYGGNQANYDISPDGSRFLMIRNTSESKPRVVNVILNWDKL